MPKSFSTFEMLNRLKDKEYNIFADVWFIENLQQKKEVKSFNRETVRPDYPNLPFNTKFFLLYLEEAEYSR